MKIVFERELLQEDGMMIIEHSKYTKMTELDNFSFQKGYGGSFFSFYELNQDRDEEVDGFEEEEG